MILGGIPYYMSYVQPGESVEQIIDRLFVRRNAKLAVNYSQAHQLRSFCSKRERWQ